MIINNQWVIVYAQTIWLIFSEFFINLPSWYYAFIIYIILLLLQISIQMYKLYLKERNTTEWFSFEAILHCMSVWTLEYL